MLEQHRGITNYEKRDPLMRMRDNPLFRELVSPIENGKFPHIRDAGFFIRNDGMIVNAEGWFHPDGLLVGEVMYIPDENGDRAIFGEQYRKATLYPGTYTPVPYRDRAQVLSAYDPSLDQTSINPYFARYKQIFPHDEFVAHISAEAAMHTILTKVSDPKTGILADLENASDILGIDMVNRRYGLTGGPSLGNITDLHDLDIVHIGSLEENIRLARAFRELVRREPNRRVIEGGKGWNIRYYNDRGTLMCNFFSYEDPEDAPLRNFTMDVIQEDVVVEATVSDETHTLYTPTVLGIDDAVLHGIKGRGPVHVDGDEMQVIAYHTATRGECFLGDNIVAQGALVNITTPDEEYQAVCVIDREGVRNRTPTWTGFYEN